MDATAPEHDDATTNNEKGERKGIVDFICATHDVEAVKQLLRNYPDMCRWDEFDLHQNQLHCCIISLLVEAGMTEERNHVFYSAVMRNDCLALAALLRDNHNNEKPWDRPKLGPPPQSSVMHRLKWNYAFQQDSPDPLNCLTQFDNPTPYILPNRNDMTKQGLRFENGRFYGKRQLKRGLWISYDPDSYPLGRIREMVDMADSPDLIEQCVLLKPDLFQDFYLTDRYRRPSLLKALAELGCREAVYVPHVCEKLSNDKNRIASIQ